MKTYFLLIVAFSSNAFGTCKDFSGNYRFRTHYMAINQLQCSEITIETRSIFSKSTERVSFKATTTMQKTVIETLDQNGIVVKTKEARQTSTFNDEGFRFELDDLEPYSSVARSQLTLENNVNFVQFIEYISRNSGKVEASQSFYGVKVQSE